nr:MAG TPA: hypothetical protein [Caudoviricetes sp.]
MPKYTKWAFYIPTIHFRRTFTIAIIGFRLNIRYSGLSICVTYITAGCSRGVVAAQMGGCFPF